MPPRSVCLNVFTKGLGEAVRDDGSLMRREEMNIHPIMERRDSAQSDNTRRSSAGSFSSAPTPSSTSPMPAFRADMFLSLRPMASTESLNFTMNSKPCSACSGGPAKRRCSRCKAAFYCDRGCQKADWKTHRGVCEPAQQTYSTPATPSFSSPASPTKEG